MATHRRTAKLEAVLVRMDEPQVITLVAHKTKVVAVAVPDDDQQKSMFLATTVSEKDWNRYVEGTADLRYLFTVPTVRTLYRFDLQTMKDGKVRMDPLEVEPDEASLPHARFFSINHTEDVVEEQKSTDPETLLIDGEWELTDLGSSKGFLTSMFSLRRSAVGIILISRKRQESVSKTHSCLDHSKVEPATCTCFETYRTA